MSLAVSRDSILAAAQSAVRGFHAYRPASAGSVNGVIANWTDVVWNSHGDFDATTGEFTAPIAGDYLIMAMGFPAGGLGTSAEWQIELEDGAGTRYILGRQYNSSGNAGNSDHISGLRTLAKGDVVRVQQRNDVAEHAAFAVLYLDPARNLVGFDANKASTSGSVNSVVSGWTENIDYGADFDGTTFTVPEAATMLIGGQGFAAGGHSGGAVYPDLRVNGTTVSDLAPQFELGTGAHGCTCGFTSLLSLSASDALTIYQMVDVQETMEFWGVTIPSNIPCAFSAHKTSQSDAGALTDVTGMTERFDLGGDFNASTGIFTAPSDGVYFFGSGANGLNTSGVEAQARVYDITNSTPLSYARQYFSGASHRGPVYNFGIKRLKAGNTVKMQHLGTNSSLNFHGVRLGE